MNIFEELNRLKVCYAIGIDLSYFKFKEIENNSRNYFIIGLSKNNKKLKKLGFSRLIENPRLMTINLIQEEIALFKSIQNDKFIKVIHNKFGRVYELKNYSFRNEYNQLFVNKKN